VNRRHLLQFATGATAVQTLTSVVRAAKDRSPTEIAGDEDFWAAVRNEFTIDRLVVNFNNGHVSPSPRTVQEVMRRYLAYSDMGPYHTMIRQLEPKIEMARRMIAEVASCDPEEIAITRNASESLEIAQLGIKLSPGDEVLTTNQDYPRMLTTFDQRARREGIRVKKISFPLPVTSQHDLYRRFEEAITPATKLILVCHITNLAGQIFPVRRICDMAHGRGIKVIVDGAHAFNHFPFRLPDLGCDYYGVSLHKWTFAPIGTGFLYVRKPLIRETWALMASAERQDDDIRKFEEIGTHPSANYAAICEAVVFNQNIGIERKAARLRYLKDRWASALGSHPKVRILHNPSPEMSCGIGLLGLRDGDLTALGQALEARHGIYTAVARHAEFTGMRITPSVYSTVRDIDYFVRAVETELKRV
jgi:selenocysteine lyase/cysteine desulfurase